MRRSIWLGWDSRERAAFYVAKSSLLRHARGRVNLNVLRLPELQRDGLYWRRTETRFGPSGEPVLWDLPSDAPMSTMHANARFLVRHLARDGWALFTDCDVMFRRDPNDLFDMLDPARALYCVQHQYEPAETVKMDGQIQTRYARKNWSSVFALNCDHPANQALTLEVVNTFPGRDLHRFCWLHDDLIGALPPEWNYLVGVNPPIADPAIVHFTLGTPDMKGFEDSEWAREWRQELCGTGARR